MYLPDSKEYMVMESEDHIAFPDIKKDDLQSEVLTGNEELEIGGLIDILHPKIIPSISLGNISMSSN